MGKIDSRLDAVQTQLTFEEISATPGGEIAEVIGDLVKIVASGGLLAVGGGASNLLQKVRKLAGASYGSNLIYVFTELRNELADLYQGQSDLRGRIESLCDDPQFSNAIAALALRAMHTSERERLKRLSRIVVSGVIADDLEPEGLDDMMRAAVELTERDIHLLKEIYEAQVWLFRGTPYLSSEWSQEVMGIWSMKFDQLDRPGYLRTRSSLARLQSLGLIAAVETMMARDGSIAHQPFGLLQEGKNFYERLKNIAGEG
jgi:hypothetical protein